MGDVLGRFFSDGSWNELSPTDLFLDTAFYQSRIEMLDTTISDEGRRLKARDVLHAAILGDSVVDKLTVLIGAYEDIAQSATNSDALRSLALLLRGEVYERLDSNEAAIESYEAITENYADLSDSVPAAWRIQYLQASLLDSGSAYDSAMAAYHHRVTADWCRLAKQTGDTMLRRTRQESSSAGSVSEAARLDQNIPNPFSQETLIPYSLGRSTDVRLYVTDALGKLVRVLEQGSHAAGDHSAVLSTTSLPAGLYFYHLEVDGQRLTRQMLITR